MGEPEQEPEPDSVVQGDGCDDNNSNNDSAEKHTRSTQTKETKETVRSSNSSRVSSEPVVAVQPVKWYHHTQFNTSRRSIDIFIAWRYIASMVLGQSAKYRFLWLHDLVITKAFPCRESLLLQLSMKQQQQQYSASTSASVNNISSSSRERRSKGEETKGKTLYSTILYKYVLVLTLIYIYNTV